MYELFRPGDRSFSSMQGDLYRFGGSKTERFFLRGVAKTREENEREGKRKGCDEGWESLTIDPVLQSVYNLLGETLSRLQQYAEAERWFQASLASQPDHVPAHITYGKLLARNVSSYQF